MTRFKPQQVQNFYLHLPESVSIFLSFIKRKTASSSSFTNTMAAHDGMTLKPQQIHKHYVIHCMKMTSPSITTLLYNNLERISWT